MFEHVRFDAAFILRAFLFSRFSFFPDEDNDERREERDERRLRRARWSSLFFLN